MGLPKSNKNENNHGGGNIIEKFLGKCNWFFKQYLLFIYFIFNLYIFCSNKYINIIINKL